MLGLLWQRGEPSENDRATGCTERPVDLSSCRSVQFDQFPASDQRDQQGAVVVTNRIPRPVSNQRSAMICKTQVDAKEFPWIFAAVIAASISPVSIVMGMVHDCAEAAFCNAAVLQFCNGGRHRQVRYEPRTALVLKDSGRAREESSGRTIARPQLCNA